MYVCGYLIFYLFFPVSDKVGMGRKERGFELIISACTFAITYVLASFVPVVDEWNFLYRCYALLCCALVQMLLQKGRGVLWMGAPFLAAAVALALHQRPLRRFRKALWAYVGAVLALDLALYALRLGDIFLA